MLELLQKVFKWKPTRDNNYYFGLILLKLGIATILIYLIWDAYEPLSFLITFLLCGWGFVLLWKSDNDLRFQIAQARIEGLEEELDHARFHLIQLAHCLRKQKRTRKYSANL